MKPATHDTNTAPRAPGALVLPAYARHLIDLRDAGRHPRFVVVVLGRRFAARGFAWLAARLEAPPPLMALADDVEARALSWFIVRGLAVVIANADRRDDRDRVLLELIAQLGREAAPVMLYRGGALEDPDSLDPDATDLLDGARYADRLGRWPGGWSDALQDAYLERAARWMEEGGAHE